MVPEGGAMITIPIDRSKGAEYIYHQIYQRIKEEIFSRNLLPGKKLPSKRELAETLNVSINSVNAAYQQNAFWQKVIFIRVKEKAFL